MAKFIVALQVGGLMEDPEFRFCNFEEIEAETRAEAETMYNRKNKCDFFYGKCIGVNGEIYQNWVNEMQTVRR